LLNSRIVSFLLRLATPIIGPPLAGCPFAPENDPLEVEPELELFEPFCPEFESVGVEVPDAEPD
jgi:hypothetical protein